MQHNNGGRTVSSADIRGLVVSSCNDSKQQLVKQFVTQTNSAFVPLALRFDVRCSFGLSCFAP